MGGVARLSHEEKIALDPECLSVLLCDLGPIGAEAVICRAMEEIAQRLDSLAEPHLSGQWMELARRARGLAAIAEPIGMTKLSAVSTDVAVCAARCEAPALGATLARLDRVAHRSLAAIWDMQDFGG